MGSKIRQAFAMVVVATLAGVGPGKAQQIAPETYVPMIGVYVDALVEEHLLALRCAPETMRPGGRLYDWDQARATLVASLSAGGYPDDLVRDVDRRMSVQAKQAPCDEAAAAKYEQSPIATGTLQWTERLLGALGVAIVTPPDKASWDRIAAVFEEQRKLQAREFACMAVTSPLDMPVPMAQWNQMIIAVGETLIARGYPKADVVAEIEAGDPNRLWQRVAEDERQALIADCEKDDDWAKRYYEYRSGTLQRDIEALLPPVS
jgi:hypothetical protein